MYSNLNPPNGFHGFVCRVRCRYCFRPIQTRCIRDRRNDDGGRIQTDGTFVDHLFHLFFLYLLYYYNYCCCCLRDSFSNAKPFCRNEFDEVVPWRVGPVKISQALGVPNLAPQAIKICFDSTNDFSVCLQFHRRGRNRIDFALVQLICARRTTIARS